jgi:multisubunit Na+/H+ antiporter MnhG subunit
MSTPNVLQVPLVFVGLVDYECVRDNVAAGKFRSALPAIANGVPKPVAAHLLACTLYQTTIIFIPMKSQ